jgi:phosphoserine phosphatase
MKSNISVISIDLDGVLFDGPSAAYELAKAVGIGEVFARESMRFKIENLTLEESLIEGAKMWKGIPAHGRDIEQVVHNIPLMNGAEEVVKTLQNWGYEVGCISSGVSQFFMNPFRERLGLDFTYSNILEESDGLHTGKIEYVMGGPQKAERIIEYLEERSKSVSSLAAIGDGLNDIDIFKVSSFSIAFNPADDLVSQNATHHIVSKDLRDVLTFFEIT